MNVTKLRIFIVFRVLSLFCLDLRSVSENQRPQSPIMLSLPWPCSFVLSRALCPALVLCSLPVSAVRSAAFVVSPARPPSSSERLPAAPPTLCRPVHGGWPCLRHQAEAWRGLFCSSFLLGPAQQPQRWIAAHTCLRDPSERFEPVCVSVCVCVSLSICVCVCVCMCVCLYVNDVSVTSVWC